MCGMKISNNRGPSLPNFPSFPHFGGGNGGAQRSTGWGGAKNCGASRPQPQPKNCSKPQPKDCDSRGGSRANGDRGSNRSNGNDRSNGSSNAELRRLVSQLSNQVRSLEQRLGNNSADSNRGTDRSDRSDRNDRSDRCDRSTGNEQSSRSDRSDRNERSDRSDRSNRNEQSGRSDRSDRNEQSGRSDRSDRNEQSGRSDRSDRNEQSDRSDRSDRNERPDRGGDKRCDNGNDRDLGWDVVGANGVATIKLGDRYEIAVNEQNATWTLKDKCGNETKVWGDPHVDVGNNGSTDFDFKKDATFQLEDGTKITVGTTQWENTDAYVSSTLTITNGNNAIKVTGLGDKADGANNLWIEESKNGRELDRQTNDGAFTAVKDGAGWKVDGKPVTQALVNAKEAAAA